MATKLNEADETFRALLDATRVAPQQPKNVELAPSVKNLHKSLCFPIHFSCLGQMCSWSRPNIKSYQNISSISDLAKFATWAALEFGMLNVNIPELGSPCGWRTTNQTEEELRMLIFPDSKAKYDAAESAAQTQDEGEGEGRRRRAPKKPKQKQDKKQDTGPEALFDFNFCSYRPDITKHIQKILTSAKTNVTDFCFNLKYNPKVMFTFKTTDAPSVAPEAEMEEEEREGGFFPVPGLGDDNDPDLFKCQQKFDINIIQLPSSLYTEANSFIVVITPLDESYDPIQCLKYLDSAFKRAKDLKIDGAQKPRFRNNQQTNMNVIKADMYGISNPLANDDNVTCGGFYNENQLDSLRARTGGADLASSVETSHGIKSASIADEEFGWLYMLTSYFQLSELAAFESYCRAQEAMGTSVPPEFEETVVKTISKKAEKLLFKTTLNNGDRQKTDYEPYRHGLNPRRLFTIENAINIIQFIENSIRELSPTPIPDEDIKTKFNLDYTRLHYPWTETNRTNITVVKEHNLPVDLYKKGCYWSDMVFKTCKNMFIESIVPRDDISCSIYNYEHHTLHRFCWLKKNGITNTVQGLSSEYFPWSKPIYAIPQSLLRYKKNVMLMSNMKEQQVQEKTVRQRYRYHGHTSAKNTEEIAQEDYDPDFLNDFTTVNGKIVRKKTDFSIPFTKWTTIPFNPITCTKSFVPSCKLPVMHSSPMFHQACLKYRHDALYAEQPTSTDILYCMAADRNSDFTYSTKNGMFRLPWLKFVSGEIPWNYITVLMSNSECIPRFNAYLNKYKEEARKSLAIMNDFAKLKREYSWYATHYFEDLFLNPVNLGKFRTSDAFNRMTSYYIEESKQGKSTFIPSHHIKFVLGSTSILPQEELLGLHLNDIAGKMSVLHDTFGNQKLKIHVTAWGGIILGHMDLSQPMMFHIFIAGEKALGKSRSKAKIEDFLIPGIVKDFAAMSENSLMITGDRSGSVWTSEESIQALFDKLEFGDKVQLFKTLMSDGNLAKTLCNYDTGVRRLLTATAFLRVCMILCFNKTLEALNGPIRSRVHATTLGSTQDSNDSSLVTAKNPKKRQREESVEEAEPAKKQRVEEATMEVDIAPGDQPQVPEPPKETKKEKFLKQLDQKRNNYVLSIADKKNKIKALLGASSSLSNQESPKNNNPQEDSRKPVTDAQNNPFSSLETIKIIFAESRQVDENLVIQHYKQHVDRILREAGDKNEEKGAQMENSDNREMKTYASLCELLQEMNPQFNADQYRELLNNTLKTDLEHVEQLASKQHGPVTDGHGIGNTMFSNFETSRDSSSGCARIAHAQDLFRDYVRFESEVSFFTHQAILEGRLTISKRLFWVLLPLFITSLKERCPFIHVDQRSVTRMLILATNFTINKSFREEFMSPIDIWTGKPNPKYNISFKPYFIQDLAPRLFLTTGSIVAAFTIIAEEIVNPWMHDIFLAMFSKLTEFFQFYRALLSYEEYINKEHAGQWLSKKFQVFTTQKIEMENSTKDRPIYETRHIMNIPTALTCGNPYCAGESFYKMASFLEFYDIPSGKTVYDMNYIVLAQEAERSFPPNSDAKSMYRRTMRDLLTANICDLAGIRIGREAVSGLVEKLFDEMITIQTVFELVEKDVILSLFEQELEFVQRKTVPHFSVYQKSIEPKRTACLSIKNIQVTAAGERKVFLLLSTHAMVKTLSDEVVIDSMKDFLKQTPNRESILTLGMTKVTDILKDKKVDGLTDDVQSFIKTHLQQIKVGIDDKFVVDEEKRTRTYVCVDASKKSHITSSSSDNNPHFYYNFVNTELKNKFVKPQEVVVQPPGSAVVETVDDITFTDNESLDAEIEFSNKMKETLEKEIPKDIIIMHTDTDMWAAYTHFCGSMCSQLKLDVQPLSNVTDEPSLSEFVTECRREKLSYFHQKVPVSSRHTTDQAADYINAKESCGDWRPVSSLVPANISKRYFKLRWQNKEKFGAFTTWKYALLEFYNKHIVAPNLDITKKKNENVFYSKKLGTYIPKYVLRDLYRYQVRLAENMKD